MVLWRLPMALAEVKLDGMLSGKLTDTELAAINSPITTAVILRLWRKKGLQGRYFLSESLRVPDSLFGRQFGQVPDSEPQVGFQVAYVSCWGSNLRGTVTAEEYRLTGI